MATFPQGGAGQIWRDFVVDAVDTSGKHRPRKEHIREWGGFLEGLLNGINAGQLPADMATLADFHVTTQPVGFAKWDGAVTLNPPSVSGIGTALWLGRGGASGLWLAGVAAGNAGSNEASLLLKSTSGNSSDWGPWERVLTETTMDPGLTSFGNEIAMLMDGNLRNGCLGFLKNMTGSTMGAFTAQSGSNLRMTDTNPASNDATVLSGTWRALTRVTTLQAGLFLKTVQ